MPRERNAGSVGDGNGFRRRRVSSLALGRWLLSREQWQQTRESLGLSSRELELVQHIFDGKKLATIARADDIRADDIPITDLKRKTFSALGIGWSGV